MSSLRQALFRDLKQVLWALFLVYLFLAVIGLLFARQIGFEDALLICLIIAVLVTITFFTIYLFMAFWVCIELKIKDRFDGRRKGS